MPVEPRQAGRWIGEGHSVRSQPAAVSEGTKQAGEVRPGWDWVERTVWTDRMLEASKRG